MLDFNTPSAFKGYEMGRVTLDDIVKEMETFVRSLPATSPHLKFIRVKLDYREFTISLGLKSSLAITMDEITDALTEPQHKLDPQTSELLSTVREGQHEIFGLIAPPEKRPRIQDESDALQSIDLANIQEVWDRKISNVFEQKGLGHRSFPIIESITDKLPYKFFLNCPRCLKKLYVTLTLDPKPSGRYVKNFRFYTFTSHAIPCILENSQDFHEDTLSIIKMEPSDEM